LLSLTFIGTMALINYRVTHYVSTDLHQHLLKSMEQNFHSLRKSEAALSKVLSDLSSPRQRHGLLRPLYADSEDSSTTPLLSLANFYQQHADVLDGILLFNQKAQLISASDEVKPVVETLRNLDFFQQIYQQHQGKYLLYQQRNVWQIMAKAILDEKQNVKGVLFVFHNLDITDLQNLRQQNDREGYQSKIMLFNKQQIFLNTTLANNNKRQQQLYRAWQQHLRPQLESFQQGNEIRSLGNTHTVTLDNERFNYVFVPELAVTPLFLIAYSLDEKLDVLNYIRNDFLLFGLSMLFVSLLLAAPLYRWLFSSLNNLRLATDELEHGNYQFRLKVHGGDEFAQLAQAFNQTLKGLAEKQQLHQAMSRLVSRELAESLLEGDHNAESKHQLVTVLHSHIHKVDQLFNNLNADDSLNLLNNYFTRMQFIVDAHSGLLDHYSGAQLSALFGLPETTSNHAEAALQAGFDMLDGVSLFNLEMAKNLNDSLQIGIGIHHEKMVVGNLGATSRQHYSVFGTALNISQWLQKLSYYYGVDLIISETTYFSLSNEKQQQHSYRMLDILRPAPYLPSMKIYQVHRQKQDPAQQQNQTLLFQTYEQAHQHVREQNFYHAVQILQPLQIDHPDDQATRLLLTRCQAYQKNPQRYLIENPQSAYMPQLEQAI